MTAAPSARFLGWRMVALAFLCTNLALGLTFGTYGPFVASLGSEFTASRSLLSGGLALVVTFMGLLAPLVGRAITRWSIRRVVSLGLAVLASMLILTSLAASAWQFVALFGLLGGIAAACLVIVPPTTLVNNWFVAQRGKATGIVMIPFLVMATPPIAAAAITAFGWRPTAIGLAIAVLVALPLTRLIVDRPAEVGQAPLGSETAEGSDDVLSAQGTGGRDASLRGAAFWSTTFCGGIVAGTGVTVSTHLVPFATGAGHGLQSAAFLLTVMGGGGMAGGVLFGLLADRLGGARTLGIMCLALGLLWPALLAGTGYAGLALVAAGFGLCCSAVIPVVATLLGNLHGSRSFARVMGLYSLAAMPFGLLMPVVAGWLFDRTGTYRTVFLGFALLFAAAVALSVYLDRVERAQRPRPAAALA
jgi:MFS family permease